MSMRWLFCSLLLAYGSFASAQTQTQTKVEWSQKLVTLEEAGKSHSFDFGKLFEGASIETAKLVFDTREQGARYLLFDVTAHSRGPEGYSGMCGAGEESNLIWLKLDSDWKVLASDSELYDSCFHTIELWPDSLEVTKSNYAVCALSYSQNLAIRLNYDVSHAADGIKVRKIPWVKQEDADCFK